MKKILIVLSLVLFGIILTGCTTWDNSLRVITKNPCYNLSPGECRQREECFVSFGPSGSGFLDGQPVATDDIVYQGCKHLTPEEVSQIRTEKQMCGQTGGQWIAYTDLQSGIGYCKCLDPEMGGFDWQGKYFHVDQQGCLDFKTYCDKIADRCKIIDSAYIIKGLYCGRSMLDCCAAIPNAVWHNNTSECEVPNPETEPQSNSVNFLAPTADSINYCNGADMDSEGFEKMITKKVTQTLDTSNLSETEIINKTIVLASQEANLTDVTNLETDFIRIDNDTAYIKPIDGWAGVSIFLCAWKPLVETNLLYLANINNVVWLDDLQQWEKLK